MTPSRSECSSPDFTTSGALTSRSTLTAFDHGTGLSVYRNLLLPAILNARFEVILATCFWAASDSLNELVSTLKELSSRAISVANPETPAIKVYICFSSRSATQKLFHTSSEDGHIYPPEQWPTELGLPPPAELPGLDITVKSLFFRPFSVLHSKYLIVDRQIVFFPSCNLSWEDWYECAVGLTGPIVGDTFNFWKKVWKPVGLINWDELADDLTRSYSPQGGTATPLSEHTFRTTLLPHPHNASLEQSLWFVPKTEKPLPRSPLNTTLLRLITGARSEVILLTPNFTSSAAITAVCSALLSGVHVHLITDRKMMVPEQLATAGVMTEQCVDDLIQEYRKGLNGRKLQKRLLKLGDFVGKNLEPSSPPTLLGKLKISYFCQPQHMPSSSATNPETNSKNHGDSDFGVASNATKSHIKLTLIDRKAVILGSGNMDRASWRTSQELGVLIEDEITVNNPTSVAERLWAEIEVGLKGCLETYFDE